MVVGAAEQWRLRCGGGDLGNDTNGGSGWERA